ncbi:MAG: hypothetical protein LBD59_02280 [Prevotellaceae bacterium]|jgi:hypothetical protein|nr:hypothetical protein [Prevotellaceae bacterium]
MPCGGCLNCDFRVFVVIFGGDVETHGVRLCGDCLNHDFLDWHDWHDLFAAEVPQGRHFISE